jgi:hypothetical protein
LLHEEEVPGHRKALEIVMRVGSKLRRGHMSASTRDFDGGDVTHRASCNVSHLKIHTDYSA